MNTLALICKAYLGRSVRLQPNRILDKVRNFSGEPATDGRSYDLQYGDFNYPLEDTR